MSSTRSTVVSVSLVSQPATRSFEATSPTESPEASSMSGSLESPAKAGDEASSGTAIEPNKTMRASRAFSRVMGSGRLPDLSLLNALLNSRFAVGSPRDAVAPAHVGLALVQPLHEEGDE